MSKKTWIVLIIVGILSLGGGLFITGHGDTGGGYGVTNGGY